MDLIPVVIYGIIFIRKTVLVRLSLIHISREPCEVGADLIVGSLIKNPGGGLAPTGGYIAGKQLSLIHI